MARPWRIQFPGALYHVTARGNNRQAIYLDDGDRRDFLDLLGQAHERFKLQILAFCLMSNHYHLFLRTPQANLAAALQWLNTTYTVRFHRRHRRSGHLLQGRYKSVLVADEAHYLHLSMYLHLNPVRANLVEDPADYEWSSFRDYARAQSRFPWLAPEEILAEYGADEAGQRRHYRRQCLALSGRRPKFWKDLHAGIVLGSRQLLQDLARRHPPAGKAAAVPAYRMALRRHLDLAAERMRVAKAFALEELGLKPKVGAPARIAAYYHLVVHCGASMNQVAEEMRVGPSAVSKGIVRLRKQMEKDARLRSKIEKLGQMSYVEL